MKESNLSNSSEKVQTNKGIFYKMYRGRPEDPSWERPALLILLVLTAVFYIWDLGRSGWTNSFYSAAVQAGTKSWKAFFFGSIDASNFITVDKPPASLWVMELSARIFGLNSWSMLIPDAFEGVAAVLILYMTIRQWFSAGASLLAAGILAITPVAALMFRFNNPDACLVLMLIASAYAFTRAMEEGKTKWLVWASILIGLGFLTKMLAAFMVLPAFVLVYLLFAPVTVRKRIVQMVISALVVVVSSGWWVAIVQLTPAADRPYICSTQTNSIVDLIFGYNGLGRITGNGHGTGSHKGPMGMYGSGMGSSASSMGEHGSFSNQMASMMQHGGGMGGSTGITRLFNSEFGGQISWLIPAALILLFFSIWLTRRNWKKDHTISALFFWGVWLIVNGIVYSYMQGTMHSYYTNTLAPSIGAIIGIGVEALWRRRDQLVARSGLVGTIVLTVVWSYLLLDRTPTWNPWLRTTLAIIGLLAAIVIVIGPRIGSRLMVGATVAGLAAGLAGPFAYTIQTIATPHTGSSPSAGPTISNNSFSGHFGGGQMRFGNARFGSYNGKNAGNFQRSGFAGFGGFGGGNTTPSKEIVKLLQQNASKYTWVAATVDATSSAPYQLATGDPVMDIGGFSGSDPSPTLSQFKKYVSEGKIHYFISSGKGFGGGFNRMGGNMNRETNSGSFGDYFRNGSMGGFMGGGTNSTITSWVQSNFQSTTVNGVTVYDLTKAK